MRAPVVANEARLVRPDAEEYHLVRTHPVFRRELAHAARDRVLYCSWHVDNHLAHVAVGGSHVAEEAPEAVVLSHRLSEVAHCRAIVVKVLICIRKDVPRLRIALHDFADVLVDNLQS